MINDENHKVNSTIILFIYLIGALNWLFFFNYGSYNFNYEDWAFYSQMYSVWKVALTEKLFPFFALMFTEGSILREGYGNDYFFAKNWSFFQPQIILLKYLSIKSFLTFNFLLFYSILFYSLILWINFLKIEKIYSYILIVIIIFNGKFFSQVAFGGPQMTMGYMLVPLFFWNLKNFLIYDYNLKLCLKFSLFMFFVLSQADMHIYYQMFLIMGIFTIFHIQKYFPLILIFLISTLSSAWYVIPVLFYGDISQNDIDHWRHLGTFGIGFANGFSGESLLNYSSEFNLIKNIFILFLNFFIHVFELTTSIHNINMPNTHEVNFFISVFGLFFLLIGVLTLFIKYRENSVFSKYKFLFLSTIILLIISSGPFHYLIIKFLKIFINFKLIDAVPSRFFFYFMIIITLISFYCLSKFKILFNKKILYCILLILIVYLLFHSYSWWMSNSYLLATNKHNISDLEVVIYEMNNYKSYYKHAVIYSYIFSSFCLCFLIFFSYIFKWNKFSK